MQLHDLKTASTKDKKRVGRGGKRGKTSGRGTKGQKARSGHRIRPEARDIIKKIPKRRGHGKHRAESTNPSNVKPTTVNLALLDRYFEDGATISPETLREKGLVRARGGKLPKVKILGGGTTSKKFVFKDVTASESVGKKLGI